MSDPPAAPAKKAARVFDMQAMMDQARKGAQERSTVDWSNEIEKTKQENESRIAEMKIKADEAAKKMQHPTNNNYNSNAIEQEEDDDDDEGFGPSIDLAAAPAPNDEDTSSDEEDPSKVRTVLFLLCYQKSTLKL